MSQPGSSQIRRDVFRSSWVLVAPHWQREQLEGIPRDQWPTQPVTAFTDPDSAGVVKLWDRTASLPDGNSAQVRVISNRYPLYRVEGVEERKGHGLYDSMKGIGAHEMVLESISPEQVLTSMHPQHLALILGAWKDRINDLKNDSRLRSFSIFREWTAAQNPPAAPPHSQLIASTILPPALKDELDAARHHYEEKERCLYCDVLDQELIDKVRIVREDEHFVSMCPYASRTPFESLILPRRHYHDFSAIDETYALALAENILDLVTRMEQAIPGWRILMVLHTTPELHIAPMDAGLMVKAFHWHIEFMPQPPGSLDWAARSGTPVVHTPPEKAAEYMCSLPGHD